MSTHTVHTQPSYIPMGEQALVVQFENILSIEVNQRVRNFVEVIKQAGIHGINQLIPAFNSLAISYDPIIIDFYHLIEKLQQLEGRESQTGQNESKIVHLPVAFGGNYGPDLDDVAKQTGIPSEEVKHILQDKTYLVYMVGFIAGFPYCGDIDDRLVLPRRSSPRLKVEKGSIAIANKQTGIYTIASPGGWHLVGWTPMETFNPYHEPPSLLLAGDSVKFVPIGRMEAEQWDHQRQRKWDQEWNS